MFPDDSKHSQLFKPDKDGANRPVNRTTSSGQPFSGRVRVRPQTLKGRSDGLWWRGRPHEGDLLYGGATQQMMKEPNGDVSTTLKIKTRANISTLMLFFCGFSWCNLSPSLFFPCSDWVHMLSINLPFLYRLSSVCPIYINL